MQTKLGASNRRRWTERRAKEKGRHEGGRVGAEDKKRSQT